MDQTRVDPLLLDDELDLVMEARLVGGGEGEEGHADVDLRRGGGIVGGIEEGIVGV